MKRSVVVSYVVAVLASALVSGCAGDDAPRAGADQTASVDAVPAADTDSNTDVDLLETTPPDDAPESWSAYLPERVGDGCVLAIEPIEVDGVRVTSEADQQVVSIDDVDGGTAYQIETTTTVTTDDTDPPVGQPEHDVDSSSETYTYIAQEDGTVSFASARYGGEGFPVDVDTIGVLFPTVEEVRAGAARDSEARMTLSALDDAGAAELRAMTSDGSAELHITMVFHVSGVPTASVSTPAGTFTDVVGVKAEVTSTDLENVTPESADQFDEVMEALTPRATTWLARGTGVVQVSTVGGLSTGVVKAQRCTGADGLAAPTEPADGAGGSGVDLAPGSVIAVPETADGAAFTTPSGNITCAISDWDEGPEARCDIYDYDYTPPPTPSECVTDYGGAVQLTDTAQVLCAGDSIISLADVTASGDVSDYTTWFDPASHELVSAANDPGAEPHQAALAYGTTISYAGISCTSAETGVRCVNDLTGASFALSRAALTLDP